MNKLRIFTEGLLEVISMRKTHVQLFLLLDKAVGPELSNMLRVL
jgi:hypothetical protein